MVFPWFSYGFFDAPHVFPRHVVLLLEMVLVALVELLVIVEVLVTWDAPGFNSHDATHGHALFTYMTGPLFWVNVGKKVGKKVGPLFWAIVLH